MRSPVSANGKNEQIGVGVMGDQNRLEKNFEALAALLADIARELESESEEDISRIRELQEHCILELALLRKTRKKDSDSNTICQ
jgi:hypothetical protein